MGAIRSAEVVLPCADLDATLAFFTERLGFRVDAVFPADDPRVAVVSGHGVRLRLTRGDDGAPGALRLLCDDPAAVAGGVLDLTAPNGTRIELAASEPDVVLPSARPSFVLTRAGDGVRWVTGRAGMDYRDLVPDRQGGRFIASHVRIADGGPVPDYVHFHRVRFQMIFCRRGWVRVVYEDQGPSFVLEPGDCVLQPPGIRHRVLESSPGLEVIEISSPAEHETLADHDLGLPTTDLRPERDFGGQRFVRHVAADSLWTPGPLDGLEFRDTGIAAASRGVATARVVRVAGTPSTEMRRHDAEFLFTYVLQGTATLVCDGRPDEPLGPDDAFVPGSKSHRLTDCSDDLEFLQATLPA